MKRINGICLITPDVVRLRDFYQAVLQAHSEGDEVFATCRAKGAQLSFCHEQLLEQMAPNSRVGAGRGSDILEIEVQDVDQEYQRLMDLNVPIVKPPTTQPWGLRSVWFRDPDGNLVNFYAAVTSEVVKSANQNADNLRQIVERAVERLQGISDLDSQTRQHDGQWSAKQILGHLIDSAANNHQRFVRAQFTDDLLFPGYEQEQWIQVQHYEDEAWSALLELWRGYNFHLAHVIAKIPQSTLHQARTAHTLDKIAWQPISATESTTLEYLIHDYLGHLQAHLKQLFTLLQLEYSE